MDNLCDITDEELERNLAKPLTENEPNSCELLSSVDNLDIISDKPNAHMDLNALSPIMPTCSSLATSPLTSPSMSTSSLPQQAIRSQMRRDFLRLLSSLHKKDVSVKLYECPMELTAKFEGCNAQFTHLFVNSLSTPIGVEKCALIRTNDVIELTFNLDSNQTK